MTACIPTTQPVNVVEPEISDTHEEPCCNCHPAARSRMRIHPANWWITLPVPVIPFPDWLRTFNTTIREIREANPIIPNDASTMPPGFPMKIPIYYQSLWGTPFQIIPDSQFVYGPAQKDFDPVAFVKEQPGWLKNYTVYASGENRTGGEIVNLLAQNYSVSPRLILAMIEYQTGALTKPSLHQILMIIHSDITISTTKDFIFN